MAERYCAHNAWHSIDPALPAKFGLCGDFGEAERTNHTPRTTQSAAYVFVEGLWQLHVMYIYIIFIFRHSGCRTWPGRRRLGKLRPCNAVAVTLAVVLAWPSGEMQQIDSADLARCMYLNAKSGTRRQNGHGFSNAVTASEVFPKDDTFQRSWVPQQILGVSCISMMTRRRVELSTLNLKTFNSSALGSKLRS